MKENKLKISLLTGGHDAPYVIPLTEALIKNNVVVEFIGNDDMEEYDTIKKNNKTLYSKNENLKALSLSI